MQYKIYCKYEDHGDRLAFYIFEELPGGKMNFFTDLKKGEYKEYTVGEVLEPTFVLKSVMNKQFLQAMVDAIYKEAGILPTQSPVLEDQLSATKYHLEDMRKLVFDK